MSDWVQNMMAGAKAAIAGWAGFQGVKGVVEAADNLTTTMNRLRAAMPDDAEGAEAAFQQIYESAKETGVQTDATAQSFMRFAPAMRKLGYDASDTIQMLDGIQKGMLAGGQTAAETREVIRQLGQAMTSTVFQGDELRSFMEGASATMIDTFATALGTTSDKLKEMGSKGNLTAKNVLPALIAASKAGRDEFGKMEVTVGLAWSRARVILTHTLAEFDKIVKVSKYAGMGVQSFVTGLMRFENFLPTLRDVVNRLGGMDRIMQVAVGTVGGLVAAVLVLNTALRTMIVRSALAWAPWILGAAAIGVVVALIMDFVEWAHGEDVGTLFRDWFGPFDEAVKGWEPQIAFAKQLWTGFVSAIGDSFRELSAEGEWLWPNLVDEIRIFGETTANVARAVGPVLVGMFEAARADFAEFRGIVDAAGQRLVAWKDTAAAVFGFIGNLVTTLVANFVSGFGTIIGWIERGKAALQGWFTLSGQGSPNAARDAPGGFDGPRRGTLAPWTRPVGDEEFRQEMRNLLNFGAAPDMAGKLAAGGGGPTNQTQQNTISIQVPVTATGASGAEVAAGAEAGVARAADRLVDSLREAQVSMPLTEAPAQ